MTTSTRSPTPQVLMEKPSRRWASTLSPSVTATSRMLSPKRAIFPPCQSALAHAARVQVPISLLDRRRRPSGPTTTLRSRRRRAAMNPNSRSPWAAWFRFMKSMSMSAQGISRLYCVWRCRNGLPQGLEAGDPHLGRAERVHPRDQARRRPGPRWPRGPAPGCRPSPSGPAW